MIFTHTSTYNNSLFFFCVSYFCFMIRTLLSLMCTSALWAFTLTWLKCIWKTSIWVKKQSVWLHPTPLSFLSMACHAFQLKTGVTKMDRESICQARQRMMCPIQVLSVHELSSCVVHWYSSLCVCVDCMWVSIDIRVGFRIDVLRESKHTQATQWDLFLDMNSSPFSFSLTHTRTSGPSDSRFFNDWQRPSRLASYWMLCSHWHLGYTLTRRRQFVLWVHHESD